VGYDWVCPMHEVSPEAAAAASTEATSDQGPSPQSPAGRAPSAGEDPIVIPKMRVRRIQAQGPARRDWTPPGPSRLRETVEAQENEKLKKVHRDFEQFKITGKQPPVSVPIGGPQVTQYCPLGSSTYRPFSTPPNVTDPTRLDERQGPSGRTQHPTSRRLGSTDLFPDRYRQESPSVIAPTEARDTIAAEVPKPATRDSAPQDDASAPPDDASIPSYQQSEADSRKARANSDGSDSAPPATPDSAPPDDASVPPRPQSETDSRRARANSNGSDRSSTSSTESSRARKSLRLDKGKAGWSPNASKSTASLSFAGFKTAVKNIANTLVPTGGKSEAETLTRELSRSPKMSGDRVGRDDDGYETDQADENARPASSSRRRSRKSTVAAASSSSGGNAGCGEGSASEQAVENVSPASSSRRRSRKNTDAAAIPFELDTSIGRLGILPSPPKPSSPVSEETAVGDNVDSGGASQKQGPITSEFRALIS
jgi:hypothetical protein